MRFFILSLLLPKRAMLGILLEDFYTKETPESQKRLEDFVRKNNVTVETVANGVRYSM